MSPRKTILRELSRQYEREGAERYTRPSAITGFVGEREKYQKAVNDLLHARLVKGRKDDEGHMAIALNGKRWSDIRRELKHLWARPALWAVIVLVLAAVGAGLTV